MTDQKVSLPTLEFLMKKAACVVDHINHKEYVMDGVRYFVGYSSEGVTRWASEYGYNVRDVRGWIVYNSAPEN